MARSPRLTVLRSIPVRTTIVAIAMVVAALPGHTQAVPWISPDDQTQLIEVLRAKLPAGWALTSAGIGTLPDDWRSRDRRTFQVDGKNGERSFSVWFMPVDWIGVRRPHPTLNGVYWEGVLANSTYKSITAGERSIHNAVMATAMNTPSLVNGGWDRSIKTFGNRLDEIDAETQALVREFCTTRECIDEAAVSLIVLGVPARSLSRDCAEHSIGRAQEYCAGVLGYWGERENVPLLNALVARATIPAGVRGGAAFSLERLADPSSGPALQQALQATPATDELTTALILDAISRIHDTSAGPQLVKRLNAEKNVYTQARLAKTLADVRYAEAAPDIERVCSTTAITSGWIAANTTHLEQDSLPEMALLRLTGAWGAPSSQIRVLVMPPDTLTVGGRIEVATVIENVGIRNMPMLRNTSGVWVIDGKDYPDMDRPMFEGNMSVDVNGLDVRMVDLSRAISTPGRHSISYRLLGAASKELSLEFRSEHTIAR